MTADQTEVVRWYTKARKFPQMIARLPSGERIPFGPFSIQQVVAAGVMLLGLYKTMGAWARFDLIINAAIFVTLTWGVVWLIGRIPVGARNPISVTTGVFTALTAPARGKLAGRKVHISRPVTLTHPTQVGAPAAAAAAPGSMREAPGAASCGARRAGPVPPAPARTPPAHTTTSNPMPGTRTGEPATTPTPGPTPEPASAPEAPARSGSPMTGLQQLLQEAH